MNLFSENASPLLTTEKLEKLKIHKVFTSLDFVQSSNAKLASWIGCNVSEIIKIKDKILADHNSNPIRADKLCDARLYSTVIIESGIEMVDKLLGGGIQSGQLTEIYGDSGSGKTQFAMQLSANASLKQEYDISYITTGEANPKRILETMHSLKKDGDFVESLKRIFFTHLTDVYQLLELLWTPETTRCKLVIIDSLATLFMPLQGDSNNDCKYQNHNIKIFGAISLLNKVASDLKRLAVVHRCAVLIVNHVSRWKSESTTEAAPTPYLGRYWSSVPNLRLYSVRASNDQFELSIVRNVYCPDQQAKCSFSYFEKSSIS